MIHRVTIAVEQIDTRGVVRKTTSRTYDYNCSDNPVYASAESAKAVESAFTSWTWLEGCGPLQESDENEEFLNE